MRRAVFAACHHIARLLEVAHEGKAKLGLVLHDEDARAAQRATFAGAGTGRARRKRVPPEPLVTLTLPPQSSTKPLTIVSPRPLPFTRLLCAGER